MAPALFHKICDEQLKCSRCLGSAGTSIRRAPEFPGAFSASVGLGVFQSRWIFYPWSFPNRHERKRGRKTTTDSTMWPGSCLFGNEVIVKNPLLPITITKKITLRPDFKYLFCALLSRLILVQRKSRASGTNPAS